MTKKNYTIKDIAKMAGVSKGTVDRVLHKRGKVSESADAKVKRVLNEIDFQPNPIARNLKKNKIYRVSVLMPDWQIDPYWQPAEQGIEEAIKEFKPFGVIVDQFFYHPHERASFTKKSKEILESKPDVILMAPLFQAESIEILQECKEKKIRAAFFNNHINTLNGEIFVGQDLFQSGKVAAGLLDKVVCPNSEIAIIHIDKETHMELKEDGFRAYFKDTAIHTKKVITKSISSKEKDGFEKNIINLLKENPNVEGVFVTNSKAHRVVEVLENHMPEKKISVVGYDLLKKNIEFLKKKQIEFLIHQKPKRQAYLGINYFAEHFLFGKKVPKRKLLPIDIVTAENVAYYLE